MVRAKKKLGQHFLKDMNIAQKVAEIIPKNFEGKVLEIGPGTGALTQFLVPIFADKLILIEIDTESIHYLKDIYPLLYQKQQIIEGDFLKTAASVLNNNQWFVIGNFPYNISSQILFKILENHTQVEGFGGMFQREVARRIASPPGNKEYGILSVLVQAFYDVTYEFTVSEGVFHPPPKVKTGVISGKRKSKNISCNKELFYDVVKTAFNQRRKTLHNSLKKFNLSLTQWEQLGYAKLRPETLDVEAFEKITLMVQEM